MSYRDVLLLLSRGSVQSSRGKRLMSAGGTSILIILASSFFKPTILSIITSHSASYYPKSIDIWAVGDAKGDSKKSSRRITPGVELEAGDDMRALRGFRNQTRVITSTTALCKWQRKFYLKCKF